MKVGILCECSGTVRDAFIRRGHDAVSCDLKPTRKPGPHIQGDCMDQDWSGFDLLICHPDCTYLTCSAEWAYGDGPYHMKLKPGTLVGAARREARQKAIEFVRRLNDMHCPRVAIENPVGVLSSEWREPDQYVHPHQFNDDASKKTGLWLKGLPRLIGTGDFPPRIVNGKKRWGNQTDGGQNKLPPSDDRAELRSITYPGIAEAMAAQWGGDLFPAGEKRKQLVLFQAVAQ